MLDAKVEPGNLRTHFSKVYRMRRSEEFSTVLRCRRVLRGDQVVLHYAPNRQVSARLGLIVGRKQDKRAIARNLFKRIAREAFRAVRPRLPAIDIVVRASTQLRNLDRAELRLEISRLFYKLAE